LANKVDNLTIALKNCNR